MASALYLLLGVVLGFFIGWLLGLRRATPADDRLAGELREQLGRRDAELSQLRGQLAETGQARAAAEAKHEAAKGSLAEQRAMYERGMEEAKQAQEKALTNLREAFRALSADALKQTAPEFLRLAEQSF